MTRTAKHARIVQQPFAQDLRGARLDAYLERKHPTRLDIVLEYQALHEKTSELFERDGRIYERVQGHYIPSRLQFIGVSELQRNDFYEHLPADADKRTIIDLLCWYPPEKNNVFVILGMKAAEAADLYCFARSVRYTQSQPTPTLVQIERDWSVPPPMPARLLPMPKAIHRRFGGDPLRVRINSSLCTRRLFIGGRDPLESTCRHASLSIL